MTHPIPHLLPLSTAHLRLDGISVSFADRRVLTDVSLSVSGGERTGLIGENGSGKSTLLRVAAGLIEPDAGSVSVTAPGNARPTVGLYHQEPPFPADATVRQAMDDAVADSRAAVAELTAAAAALGEAGDDPSVLEQYERALATAEHLDAWNADARIGETLARLGLSGLDTDRRTGELSGGQRARLALAWTLLSRPAVLLLDEPTNHLDDAATDYLRSVLRGWAGPVLLASHDRAFLDEVATTIVDLDPVALPHAYAAELGAGGSEPGIGLTRFTGTYSDYVAARSRSGNAGNGSIARSRRNSSGCASGWTRTRPMDMTTGRR